MTSDASPFKTKAEAKEAGFNRYCTGIPCRRGHISNRDMSGECVDCCKVANKIRYDKDPAKVYSIVKKSRNKNILAYLAKLDEWRKANPERLAATAKKGREKNIVTILTRNRCRKAKLRGADGKHGKRDILELFEKQSGICASPVCVSDLRISGQHVDHIMPIARGGSNWPHNLQLLCPSCNIRKSDKHPGAWLASIMLEAA